MMADIRSTALKLLLAAILVWLQAFTLAHAAEHGDHPHEHDGIECEITIVAVEVVAILPDHPAFEFEYISGELVSVETNAQQSWRWPPERGPPPRSPPTI